MRMLERNKRTIWYSYYLGNEEIIKDSLCTGEFEEKYTKPYKTKVNFIPVSSNIKPTPFGDLHNVDLVIMTDKNIFNEDTVIFINRPSNNNIADSYEYEVVKMIKTLNSYTIGLKKRVD